MVEPTGRMALPEHYRNPTIFQLDILGTRNDESTVAAKEGNTRARGSTRPVAGTVVYVLLALADRPRYGLDIVREVDRQTGGAIRLGPGTLYNAVGRMLTDGVIEECDAPPGSDESRSGPERKYYRITESGRDVLEAEAMRLARIVDTARLKAVLP